MKKAVIISAGVVVLVLGAVVAAPHFIDWNKYKPQIQKGIEDATGYQVEFGGPIDLAVLPFPHVVIENLTVRASREADALLTLQKAEVSLALAPLFSGEVNVSSVSLIEPVLTMAVAADGSPLWMTEKLKGNDDQKAESGDRSEQKKAEKKFALKKLDIQNGTLVYSDARTGKVTQVEKMNATVSADSLSGPFKVKGDIVWNNQKIDADIQAGRLDKAAQTIALQAVLKLPDSNAVVNYNGIVGTAGGIDLQGETRLETQNISATLTNLSGKASTLPPVALKMQGLLTAKDTTADLKNLKFAFGDFLADGTMTIQNFQAKEGPAIVAVQLSSTTPFKLESVMPVKSVKTVKAAPEKTASKTVVAKTLLPATLALPMAIDGTVKLGLAGVSYKDAVFGDVKVTIEKKGGVINATETIGQMPGGGTLSATNNISYASGSQGNAGGVTYSDPTLAFDVKGNVAAPAKLLSSFLPDATLKSMQPLFKDSITLAAKGNVRPGGVLLNNGNVALGATSVTFGTSSFTPNANGKDKVSISLSGQDINLDHFMAAPAKKVPVAATAEGAAAPSAKPAGAVLQDSLKKLDIPVDLSVVADLKNVTIQGTTYAAVNLDGSLTGDRLDLRRAALQDRQGAVMQAKGTVGELSTLTDVDLTLSGKTSDTAAFLNSFKVDASKLPKDFGPLDLSVDLSGTKPDSLSFSARASALGGQGEANGLLVNALSAKPAVDKLSLRVKHSNFEQLMKKFNPSYKSGVGIRKDMDVFANINMADKGYTLSGLDATIGGMTITGDVTANTQGSKPDIKATLNAGTIPLDILSGKDKTAKTTGGNVKTTAKAPSSNEARWSRQAINTDILRAFNLDLKVNAKAVEYGNWLLSNTVLGVTIKDGVLTIGQMDAGVYGGTMSLTADVKTSAQAGAPLSFNVKTNFKDVGLEPLAASFSGAKLIRARGDVSLDLNAGSSGASPAALVSALRGSGQVNGKNVVLVGFDLAAMSRSLVSTTKVLDNIAGLAGASMSGGETAFDKISGPFTITEGVIQFDNFLMEGPTANITNKGNISLPRWYIDMNTTIDLATPEDAPNLDMKFQGPLDNPGNTFAGKAMESYIQTRVNQKLQKVLGEKLGDQPELNNLLNSVLGGGSAKPAAPAPDPAAVPAQTAPAPEPAPQPTPEERVLKGIQSGDTEDALKGLMQGIIGR